MPDDALSTDNAGSLAILAGMLAMEGGPTRMANILTNRKLAERLLASEELASESLVDEAAQHAKAALLRSSIYTLRRLQVGTDGETIVLRGRVESFYHKQLAQELVRTAVEGVEVSNAISVVYGRDRAPAAAS